MNHPLVGFAGGSVSLFITRSCFFFAIFLQKDNTKSTLILVQRFVDFSIANEKN